MDRRNFVTKVAAVAAAVKTAMPALFAAGTPVRSKPLNADYWGPQYYDDKERQAVLEVIETGRPFRWYGRGKDAPMKVLTFEKEMAARMGRKYCLAVNSGTSALETAINALEIGPGDEVIMPAWTWHSSMTSVVRAGALPVFAEVDESFNIDPNDIEHRITPQTKLIMVVHLQGNPADLDRIMAIARKHRLKVLEDAAQSVGGSYKGKPLGSYGDIAIYSHQLNKTISAGEGGSVVTDDPILFERSSRFHDVGGMRGPHEAIVGKAQLSPFVGANYRMNEFSGGVMLAQLRKIDTIVGDVRRNAQAVYAGIRDLPGIKFRKLPDPKGEIGAGVYIRFDSKAQRDKFLSGMRAENVPAHGPSGSVILPILPYVENKVTVHKAWPTWNTPRGKAIQYGKASCPRTIDILDRFGGVLIDPKYTRKDTDDIVAAIRKVYPTVKA